MYIYIYIYIYILSKHHNTKVGIYFIFAMQLNIGIDSVYQVGLFDTFSKCHNLRICCNIFFFDLH